MAASAGRLSVRPSSPQGRGSKRRDRVSRGARRRSRPAVISAGWPGSVGASLEGPPGGVKAGDGPAMSKMSPWKTREGCLSRSAVTVHCIAAAQPASARLPTASTTWLLPLITRFPPSYAQHRKAGSEREYAGGCSFLNRRTHTSSPLQPDDEHTMSRSRFERGPGAPFGQAGVLVRCGAPTRADRG